MMDTCLQCGIEKVLVQKDLCIECIKENAQDSEQALRMMNIGHTMHCAYRQVWGDGECECNQRGGNKTPEKLNKLIQKVRAA